MIGNYFRPWGDLNWLLPKIPKIKWDLIACLSTEDRFMGTFTELEKANQLDQCLFYKIADPPSTDTLIITSRINSNEDKLKASIGLKISIENHNLLEPYKDIVDSVNRFLTVSSGNVIIDISTFPKRFFFPIIKMLMNSSIENLIVTYSTPKKYCSNELSANPHSWDHLPLFSIPDFPEPNPDVAIVGVGFIPFGLPDLLSSKYSATPVKFLFPFPPGPPNYQRTWEFMHKIEKSTPLKSIDSIIRLDSNNMPDAFEYISKETHYGNRKAIFAPYGPKPMSLAMCIYASLKESPVYYTQPNYYHPEYSSGIKDTFAYCIILGKNNLYS